MGVFSINESHFNIGTLPEVGMNESYTTNTDMCIALLESRENEFAVMEAGIKQDVIAAMNEDYEERLAINEATASGVISKIKEILTKLLEKLKSIFHAFMAKINSFFMDSDKFFKTYSSDIAKKDFKDFEIKARKFYPNRINDIINTESKSNLIPYSDGDLAKGLEVTVGDKDIGFATYDQQKRDQMMESDKLGEIAKKAVIADAALKAMSIDDDLGNVEKEIEEYVFEDPETHDDLRSTDILTSDWIGGLLNKKKFITEIDKCNKDNEKKIEKALSDLNKIITNISKLLGKDGESVKARLMKLTLNTDPSKKAEYSNKENNNNRFTAGTTDKDKSKAIAAVAYVQAIVSKEQELLIKANNARLSCAKKGMAQARKIFAAAVAYNPKKENYDLYTAVGESVEFESIMYME